MVQKKKTCTLDIYANKICQLQLNNRYDQINSEHDNVCLKRKQVEHKIRDRQYEKSKLQLQLDRQLLHHNEKKSYTHLENQINSLDEQVTKLRLLLEQLAQEETELYNRKCGLQQEMKQLNDSISTYEQTRSALTEHTNQIFKTSEILNNESKISKKDKLPIDEANFQNKYLCKDKTIKATRKRSISHVTESEAEMKEQTIKKKKICYIMKKRSSSDFKTMENDKNCQRIALKRESTSYREENNSRNNGYMKEKRKCIDYKLCENESNKTHMAKKCLDKQYNNDENVHRQQHTITRKFGSNLGESIRKFLDAVSEGPIYVCSSCHQTHFANNVVDVCNLCPQKHQVLLETCLTNFKSVNNTEWLCLSCKREIYAGLVPKLSTTKLVFLRSL